MMFWMRQRLARNSFKSPGILKGLICLSILFLPIKSNIYGAESSRVFPSEYQSAPGLALGLGNSGVAAFKGIEGLQLNPALIGLEKTYSITGSYFWPDEGREYYHAGILDAKTSAFSAAASYTGFMEKLTDESLKDFNQADFYDAKTTRRVRLGFGQIVGPSLSVGLSGQFVTAKDWVALPGSGEIAELKEIKGSGLNVGIAGALRNDLLYGLSVENLANNKIKQYAPRMYRAGFAYTVSQSRLTVNGDLSQRARTAAERNPLDQHYPGDLQTGTLGLMVQAYDVFRFLGAYSHELNDGGRGLSGGVELINKKFSISYLMHRPDLKERYSEQALSFNMAVAM